MKKLYSSPDTAEVELLKNVLADNDIVCEVRNGDMARIVPAPPFYEELWVSDEDYPKASELVTSLQHSPADSANTWTCPSCGERIEAQFTSCWKCGAQREQLA